MCDIHDLCVVGTVLGIMSTSATSQGKAFSVVLNLTGGIAGSMLSFIIPAIVYLKVVPYTKSAGYLYVPAYLCAVFGVVILVCVVVGSAYVASAATTR